MIYPKSTRFEYIDRKKKNTAVLIPGWASDYRIFNNLDLNYNYIIPKEFEYKSFHKELLAFLNKSNIKKISLFGWSMGGVIASEFCSDNYRILDKIFLLSVRNVYTVNEVQSVKENLKKNQKAYLYRFFNFCFYEHEDSRWFKKILLKSYIKDFALDYLFDCLDYLRKTKINIGGLRKVKNVVLYHGSEDRIAPISEAVQIKNSLPNSKIKIIEKCGHIPFLREKFINHFESHE